METWDSLKAQTRIKEVSQFERDLSFLRQSTIAKSIFWKKCEFPSFSLLLLLIMILLKCTRIYTDMDSEAFNI